MILPEGREKGTRDKGGAVRPPSDTIAQDRYQDLARKHLSRDLTELFTEITHLHLGVKWAPPSPLTWQSIVPVGMEGYCRLICSTRAGRDECTAARTAVGSLGMPRR